MYTSSANTIAPQIISPQTGIFLKKVSKNFHCSIPGRRYEVPFRMRLQLKKDTIAAWVVEKSLCSRTSSSPETNINNLNRIERVILFLSSSNNCLIRLAENKTASPHTARHGPRIPEAMSRLSMKKVKRHLSFWRFCCCGQTLCGKNEVDHPHYFGDFRCPIWVFVLWIISHFFEDCPSEMSSRESVAYAAEFLSDAV